MRTRLFVRWSQIEKAQRIYNEGEEKQKEGGGPMGEVLQKQH